MSKMKFLKSDLGYVTVLFLISRIILILFIGLRRDFSFLKIYDVLHYIEIAENGYTKELLYAFFPLFPMLIRLFHLFLPSYPVVAFLLSNLFSYFAVLTLYFLLKGKEIFKPVVIAFLFSPILVFHTIGYTESLYLFLTLLSYFLYTNKKYLFCGIMVGLSMITRNTGIVLLGAIGLKMLYDWHQKKILFKDIVILSLPAFLIGFSYSMYLFLNTGDFFKYISVQYTQWSKDKCNLVTFFIRDIAFLGKQGNLILSYVFVQNWLFYFIGLFFGIKYFKKDPVLSIYILVSLFLFATTCRDRSWLNLPSVSLFRYIFSLFPIYILPFFGERKRYNLPIAVLYLSFCIINSILVYEGAFIA